jgi:tRNA(fMet)-specific endonuclease VapC
MKIRFLLDTNVISSPVGRRPDRKILKRLEKHGEECAIAAPVWHELVYGCSLLPAGARRKMLESYLYEVVQVSFPILPYEETAAAWHGRERAHLGRLGRPPAFVDGQIAAIARVNDLVLVTRNLKDFAAFSELEAVDWSGG